MNPPIIVEEKKRINQIFFPLIRACTTLRLQVVYRTSNGAYRHIYR
jgi:hypothetical protein